MAIISPSRVGRAAHRPVATSTLAPAHRIDRSTTLDAATLTALGFAVDRDGIEAHEDAAKALASAAHRRGVKPILAEVLSDPSEPSAARTRAFGRLAYVLAN